MAKKGYHSLFKKSKSSTSAPRLKKAASKATKKQATRSESTFRQQPKAQRQAKVSREERRKQLVPYKHSVEAAYRPFAIMILGESDPESEKAKAFGKKLKKDRAAEKKKRTKASGGTRQSQKRRQGGY
mgnify:CR=1 FL=1